MCWGAGASSWGAQPCHSRAFLEHGCNLPPNSSAPTQLTVSPPSAPAAPHAPGKPMPQQHVGKCRRSMTPPPRERNRGAEEVVCVCLCPIIRPLPGCVCTPSPPPPWASPTPPGSEESAVRGAPSTSIRRRRGCRGASRGGGWQGPPSQAWRQPCQAWACSRMEVWLPHGNGSRGENRRDFPPAKKNKNKKGFGVFFFFFFLPTQFPRPWRREKMKPGGLGTRGET